jgi:hypothetical protein
MGPTPKAGLVLSMGAADLFMRPVVRRVLFFVPVWRNPAFPFHIRLGVSAIAQNRLESKRSLGNHQKGE